MASWTAYQLFVAGLLVVTGSIVTLATKWADMAIAYGRPGYPAHQFNHSFMQAIGMFFGEFICLIAFKVGYFYCKRKKIPEDEMPALIKGNRKYSPFIFYLPAFLDLIATCLMYIGLNLTYASSYQMLRGAVIIFTGLLSVAFLGRQLKVYEWTGMFLIIAGLSIVGVSDMLGQEGKGVNSMITGDLLIVIAQIVYATQMVIQENFVSCRNVNPLEAVGWEGFFGLITMSLLIIAFYFINVGNMIFKNPEGRLEDPIDCLHQIANSYQVAVGFIGTIITVSFFKFAGVAVTKEVSATTATVLGSIRTFVIWIVGILLSWQSFSLIQLAGFAVLIIGIFLYNDVLIRPAIIRLLNHRSSEAVTIVPPPEHGSHPPTRKSEESVVA